MYIILVVYSECNIFYTICFYNKNKYCFTEKMSGN